MDGLFSLSYPLQALLATVFTWLVTALGAALVFMTRRMRPTVMDGMLGFGAGVMLASSYWSLLAPGISMAQSLGQAAWLPACWGFLAGGIGSAMADLLGGYFVYVPITFVIKGLISLISGLIYQKLGTTSKSRYTAVILGGVVDIVLVAGGYFLCEAVFLYGFAASAASIPANIIQGVGGLIISCVLYPVLNAIPEVRQVA